MPHRQLDELNTMIGRMLEEREADHELFMRDREALALLVVGVERHITALTYLLDQCKSRIVGITPTGRPA